VSPKLKSVAAHVAPSQISCEARGSDLRGEEYEFLQYDGRALDFYPFDLCSWLGPGLFDGGLSLTIMTQSLATLPFNPLADALMAGLASRSHQWAAWEMLQHTEFALEWGPDSPQRIVQRSAHVELRVFGSETPSTHPFHVARLRSSISPSRVLSRIFLANTASEKPQLLAQSPHPALRPQKLELRNGLSLSLSGLDAPIPDPDPWTQSAREWLKIFPESPAQITDIRYRNSYGLFGFSLRPPHD
jgi:hypothetical protein